MTPVCSRTTYCTAFYEAYRTVSHASSWPKSFDLCVDFTLILALSEPANGYNRERPCCKHSVKTNAKVKCYVSFSGIIDVRVYCTGVSWYRAKLVQ